MRWNICSGLGLSLGLGNTGLGLGLGLARTNLGLGLATAGLDYKTYCNVS